MENNEVVEPKWYVVHTFSGYENMVLINLHKTIENNNLQDIILDVKIPMEDVIEEKNGKKKVVQRKMFPCYVLVKMKYTDNPAGRPLALTEDEIKRMRLEKINVDLKVNVGDKVKIISGPLADFVGDVQEVDSENQKCKVNVSMFGRLTPVEVDFDQIEIV